MGNMTKNDPFDAHATMPHQQPFAIGLLAWKSVARSSLARGLVLKRLSYRNLQQWLGPSPECESCRVFEPAGYRTNVLTSILYHENTKQSDVG